MPNLLSQQRIASVCVCVAARAAAQRRHIRRERPRGRVGGKARDTAVPERAEGWVVCARACARVCGVWEGEGGLTCAAAVRHRRVGLRSPRRPGTCPSSPRTTPPPAAGREPFSSTAADRDSACVSDGWNRVHALVVWRAEATFRSAAQRKRAKLPSARGFENTSGSTCTRVSELVGLGRAAEHRAEGMSLPSPTW